MALQQGIKQRWTACIPTQDSSVCCASSQDAANKKTASPGVPASPNWTAASNCRCHSISHGVATRDQPALECLQPHSGLQRLDAEVSQLVIALQLDYPHRYQNLDRSASSLFHHERIHLQMYWNDHRISVCQRLAAKTVAALLQAETVEHDGT